MPRVVHCDSEGCPMKTALGFSAKFCQECGRSAADVVEVVKDKCQGCGNELDDTARFCPECGTKVGRDLVRTLLENHSRPGEVTTGRGLTPDEMRAIEASIRAPSRVSDPTREYKVDPNQQAVTNLATPASDNEAVELARGRTAVRAEAGKHVPGALSHDNKIPANYHEGVRVIPYQFRTPARSPGQIVARGGPPDPEDDKFFSDPPAKPEPEPERDPDAVLNDVQAAKKVKAKKTAAQKASKDAMKRGSRPEDREQCPECGRPKNDEGVCQHCVDRHTDEPSVEELESLWNSKP